jgi:hypothetical protein
LALTRRAGEDLRKQRIGEALAERGIRFGRQIVSLGDFLTAVS